MHIIQKRRLSKLEISDIKELVKEELTFKVRVRVNREKYCAGSFNILPAKNKEFDDNQLSEIDKFLEQNRLKGNPGYWQGVSYIYGLV